MIMKFSLSVETGCKSRRIVTSFPNYAEFDGDPAAKTHCRSALRRRLRQHKVGQVGVFLRLHFGEAAGGAHELGGKSPST